MPEPFTPSWTIRPATPDDVNALLELWRRADAVPGVTDSAESIRLAMTAPNALILVAEVNGQVLGSVIGTFDGWRGNIYRLAVDPAYRRRGMARALVTQILEHIRKLGGIRVTSLVVHEHPWATGFWE